MEASVKLEHELLAVETDHKVHAMLEIAAPPAPEGTKRAPLNLALVIDRSGSMAGPKLAVTKQCAAYLLKRLHPEDKVALITYDNEVQLVASLQPAGTPQLEHALSMVHPGGQTNLSGGWMKGSEELGRAGAGEARKVVLLTDGLANVGIRDPRALAQLTAQASGTGIGTTTIGFGDDFDEDLLTSLADSGGGNSYFAATPDDAPGIFGQEFEGLMNLVAQNVSLEIRPTENVKVLGILNDFPQTSVAGGVQVNLGDAYADERRRVVFELDIPDIAALGIAKVADAVLRYVSVGDEVAAHEVTIPIFVNMVKADEARDHAPDAEVQDEVTILKAARAEKEARSRADAGDFDGAFRLLSDASGELRRMAPHSPRGLHLQAEAEKLEQSQQILSEGRYSASSSKQWLYQSRMSSHSRHRRGAGLEVMVMRAMRLRQRDPKSFARRAEGSILGVTVGNALGLQVEGWSASAIAKRFPDGVTEVPSSESDQDWDDDLAQTVCLAESLIAHPMFDPDDFARRLVSWAETNGRGMGGLTHNVISRLAKGVPASEAARNAWEEGGGNSAGNGAVMRFAPVAIAALEPRLLVRIAREQAKVTHHDPRCEWGSVALSVALSQVLVGEDVDLSFLAHALVESGARPEVSSAVFAVNGRNLSDFELDGEAMGYTLKAMQVGLWAVGAPGTFEDKMTQVVAAGGDTDTNAAVAGAMAGALHGPGEIPTRWLANIKDVERIGPVTKSLTRT